MIARVIILTGFILLYGFLFSAQEQKALVRDVTLDIALPVNFHKITSGYLKQLTAEMLFIQTSVFLGGVRPGTPPESYAEALGNNFEVMTSLYPRFIDPYYVCQGFLPHISQEAAAKANTILETGIAALPDDLILRFFHGSNFFLAMNEPLKGAKAFSEAAKLTNAPPLFGHLAALLSAQGGDIAAGLISLKIMLAGEKDEVVRARYQQEIVIFEQAIEVSKALEAYTNKHGVAPESLDQLVPAFIPQLPEIKDLFTLNYTPPTLTLQRPDKKKLSQQH
ncbi:MAG: hypothetical protein OEY01_14965 [Desulfobulbaceae bacterium]|nr:hypothetical protein [Desulfobulbaceae bacterium]HIJ79889.1 hypothetical protein [Deltaproteobacteria bacterium]